MPIENPKGKVHGELSDKIVSPGSRENAVVVWQWQEHYSGEENGRILGVVRGILSPNPEGSAYIKQINATSISGTTVYYEDKEGNTQSVSAEENVLYVLPDGRKLKYLKAAIVEPATKVVLVPAGFVRVDNLPSFHAVKGGQTPVYPTRESKEKVRPIVYNEPVALNGGVTIKGKSIEDYVDQEGGVTQEEMQEYVSGALVADKNILSKIKVTHSSTIETLEFPKGILPLCMYLTNGPGWVFFDFQSGNLYNSSKQVIGLVDADGSGANAFAYADIVNTPTRFEIDPDDSLVYIMFNSYPSEINGYELTHLYNKLNVTTAKDIYYDSEALTPYIKFPVGVMPVHIYDTNGESYYFDYEYHKLLDEDGDKVSNVSVTSVDGCVIIQFTNASDMFTVADLTAILNNTIDETAYGFPLEFNTYKMLYPTKLYVHEITFDTDVDTNQTITVISSKNSAYTLATLKDDISNHLIIGVNGLFNYDQDTLFGFGLYLTGSNNVIIASYNITQSSVYPTDLMSLTTDTVTPL